MKRFLSLFILAFAIFSSKIHAQTLQAKTYLTQKSCQEILSVTDERVTFETTTVKHVTSDEQAARMLFDYGIIFSDSHETAIKRLLTTEGDVSLQNIEEFATVVAQGASRKQREVFNRFKESLLSLLEFKDGQGQERLNRVLDSIETLAAEKGMVNFAKSKNLITEMKKLPEAHPLNRVFREYTQTVAALTYLEVLGARKTGLDFLIKNPPNRFQMTRFKYILMGALIYFILDHLPIIKTMGPTGDAVKMMGAFAGPMFVMVISIFNPRIYTPLASVRRTIVQRAIDEWSAKVSQFQLGGLGNYGTLTARPILQRNTNESIKSLVAPAQVKSLDAAAAQTSVADLTPVDIAYLGHQEKISLKKSLDLLLIEFGREESMLQEVRTAAMDLEAHLRESKSVVYPKQLRFRTALQALLGGNNEASVRAGWDTFQKKIEALRTSIRKLQTLPQASDAPLNDFLTHRIRTDLQALADQEVDAQNLNESLEQMAKQRAEVQRILNTIQTYEDDWSGAIEETYLLLEGLQ